MIARHQAPAGERRGIEFVRSLEAAAPPHFLADLRNWK